MKRMLILMILYFSFFLTDPINSQVIQIRVACVGNSLTNGGNNSQSYPQQLDVMLGDHYLVKNYGVGGTTLLKKGDYPYWNEAAYWNATDFNPHIVVICLGTNDSKPQNWIYKDNFFNDYVDLIRQFRQNGRKPQIFICFPPPVFKDGSGITNSIIRDEIIPIIDSVNKTTNTLLIDFYQQMLGDGDLFTDGIHPNAAGYTIMANIVKDAILNSPSGIIRYFNSKSPTFEQGESSTLYWETTTGSQVTINGQAVNETDSLVVFPVNTTKYTLISTGDFSDTNEVTVQYLAPGIIKSFTAYPPALDIGLGDSSKLTWSVTKGSTVTLDGKQVEIADSKYVNPSSTTTYTLIASGDQSDTSNITVEVVEWEKINRVLNMEIKVSSTARGFRPESAVDGDITTFWYSGESNTEWLNVYFDKIYDVNRVVIYWGSIYGTTYNIQLLTEAGNTKNIYSTTVGQGGCEDISGLTGEGKAIRLLMVNKNNADSGYIIKEFEVYGKPKPATGVDQNTNNDLSVYNLSQNYPNPFNPTTKIKYSIPSVGTLLMKLVQLKVYDVLGNEVATLVNETKPAGIYEVEFNARYLPSGIFLYSLTVGNFRQSRKMTYLK